MKKKSTHKQELSTIHLLRLKIFAEYLEVSKFEDYNYPEDYFCENERMPYMLYGMRPSFISYVFVYKTLAIFYEWDWLEERGVLIYKPNRGAILEDSILEFFGISPQAFCRYFIPYAFKDSTLHRWSTPKDVAYGIYELIGKSTGTTKRFVMVEKIRAKKNT